MPLYRSVDVGYPAPAVAGRWYRGKYVTGSASVTAATLGLLAGRPVRLEAGTLDRIAAQHFATTAASEVMRLGIYECKDGRPGSLVLDAGTIDLSTATAFKSITISKAIPSGVYLLAGVRQGPTSTATMVCFPGSGSQVQDVGLDAWAEMSGTTDIHTPIVMCYSVASVTAGLPDPFGTATITTASENCPMVAVRYA